MLLELIDRWADMSPVRGQSEHDSGHDSFLVRVVSKIMKILHRPFYTANSQSLPIANNWLLKIIQIYYLQNVFLKFEI